jgi:FkbM family methyltransferase
MKTGRMVRELKLWERNKHWWLGGQRFQDKALYYPQIAISYLTMTRGIKKMHYLGSSFEFDNPATPLNMQFYPHEVSQKILANIPKAPKTVLDIGGNIGQFCRTVDYFLGSKTIIDVFEPNREIFPILQNNVKNFPNIHVYNKGLSSENAHRGKKTMYFQPGRSSIGSLLKDNAGDVQSLVEVQVDLVSSPARVTKRNKYDLVKIDVEGFELEVVRSLKGIKPKYLYIEVSSPVRKRNYKDSELLRAIEETLGSFEIMYSCGFDGKAVAYDLLIRFDQTDNKKNTKRKTTTKKAAK